ncbi:phosphodiester glycosidase family protein [Streptacidiphilus fuscans]|uniref:Phosphodiester glycosidase family protein n=1 Tax=Streptacidiphilus fuscans TaxID=2789292 RepID=A0A931B8U2_9ACTN|nr:phosphodiester glycosidase family protein [Streptacidiphilus fuscans]MBF9073229.1 phosphodiester glycosidase family protein [Streptacidiphilus fuscans]
MRLPQIRAPRFRVPRIRLARFELPRFGKGAFTPKRLRWTALGTALALAAGVGYCVEDALATPGPDGTETKLAHWGRCHGLSSVVDLVDNRHQHSARSLACVPYGTAAQAHTLTAVHPARKPTRTVPPIPMHAAVQPLVSPAQHGEGVFTPLVTEDGQPVIQSTLVRWAAYDSANPVGVVWMKQKALRFDLHPGVLEPGGTWPVPPTIPPSQRLGLVAAFNGGFKVSNGDSHGGFYLDGRTVGALRDGAASEVFHKDGSLSVGVWGRTVAMTPDVTGVRQCLVPLVLNGQVTDDARYGGVSTWGLDDGGNPAVARSGVGVDRNGDVVYVGGRLLTVQDLATMLQRAGAVTAMMLDINLSWPSYISYDATHDAKDPVPHNLVNFVRAPTRYYDYSSRDFVAVHARP